MTDESLQQTGPILVVIGTRPEAVKLAPVIQELRARNTREVVVCHSGQHLGLFNDAISAFGIVADETLEVMIEGQGLAELHGRLFHALGGLFDRVRPGTIVVQGDTATVAVASWAAFLGRIEVAHVEAGLRSGNKWHPFPEEINRRITGVVADWHFAPTAGAAANLLNEGVPRDRVVLAGNTVVDALLSLRDRLMDTPLPLGLSADRPLLLVTAHRRENFDARLLDICSAVRRIGREHPSLQIVVPVHPNPEVRMVMHRELGSSEGVRLTDPLPYEAFMRIMMGATIALSDSGGVQEEAPCLGLPVLVMRDVTERPEGIDAGSARLVGAGEDTIVDAVGTLLRDKAAYAAMATPRWVYGDGHASKRIADVLLTGKLAREPFVASA
ncbi:MAG: UDP-N-acetylglucosamine 2-epimerase (non-hydrolyzing) [Gemmatimonadales bacterium]